MYRHHTGETTRAVWVAIVFALLSAPGCVVPINVTVTDRSTIEQQLLVRSLERAVAKLDMRKFAGKLVALDLYALSGDQAFAKEFVAAALREKGARLATEAEKAEVRLKVFASVLGVDRGERLIGTPTFAAPLVGLPIPEIALFKMVKHRGAAEVQIYAFDGRNGEFTEKSPVGVGNAKHDQYTILIVIRFTLSDLDERAGEVAQ